MLYELVTGATGREAAPRPVQGLKPRRRLSPPSPLGGTDAGNAQAGSNGPGRPSDAKAVCIGAPSIRHAYAIAVLHGERTYSCVHDLVIFQDGPSPRYTLLLDLD